VINIANCYQITTNNLANGLSASIVYSQDFGVLFIISGKNSYRAMTTNSYTLKVESTKTYYLITNTPDSSTIVNYMNTSLTRIS
jgi:hypothetical protein